MLRDLYDEAGLLREGTVAYQVDEIVVREPWPVDLEACLDVIGVGSTERELLGAHLRQLVGWFARAVVADEGRRIWVRGEFAATLRPAPDELDVVLIYDQAALGSSDRWVMQLLASGPIVLHPGRLVVTAIGHNDGTREIDQEARRSAVRVQDQTTGDHLVTGWLEITEGGAG
jgi:hypothetical protein